MPPLRPPIVVVAPDSFKGSLAAPAVCAAIARGVRRVWPDAEILACPMADGGEGTLDAVLSRGGQRQTMSVAGAGGATAIFGPQKGVRPEDIAFIDATLARYAALAEHAVGSTAAQSPGAGAAGGLGFALQLVGGSFRSGADVVADLIGLDAALEGATWAFTGEGRTDRQTLLGKAPFVVAERARAAGVPITLLSGAVDAASLPELGQVYSGCFALPSGPMTLDDCIAGAEALIVERTEQIARVWAAARG